ncbi:MAG: hypothetical protein KGJ60_09290 [Verrucomicrobiota bacterium]|nr:hypothetical protein [Verrucomicrobiota bacterium]
MNAEPTHFKPVWHIGLGFVIACFLFPVGVALLSRSAAAPKIDADRAAAISRALYEIHTNETASLQNAGWIDRQRGLVRLPISLAMKIAARDWHDPAAGRSNLIARVQKAAAPPPAQPAKSNPFE